ncbi:hypothetical protein KDL44_10335 [bacterium]|nr:hypothetical protein [bacterium]
MATSQRQVEQDGISWIYASEQQRRIEELSSELEEVRLRSRLELDKAQSLIWLLAVRYEQLRRAEPDREQASRQALQTESDARTRRLHSRLLGSLALANMLFLAVLTAVNWDGLSRLLSR